MIQEDIDYLEKFIRVNWGRMSKMWKAIDRIKTHIAELEKVGFGYVNPPVFTEPIIETHIEPKAIKKRRKKK